MSPVSGGGGFGRRRVAQRRPTSGGAIEAEGKDLPDAFGCYLAFRLFGKGCEAAMRGEVPRPMSEAAVCTTCLRRVANLCRSRFRSEGGKMGLLGKVSPIAYLDTFLLP